MRDQALEYLHRELRKAKQAYGQAEHRPGVMQEELDNLQRKVDALDYMVPLVLAGEETGWPVWALKMALVKVKRECMKHDRPVNGEWCVECPFFFDEYKGCRINSEPLDWDVDGWKEEENHV